MAEQKKALQLASVASMIDQFNIPNIQILLDLGNKVDVVADLHIQELLQTIEQKI